MVEKRILTSYDFEGTVQSDPQGLFIGAVLTVPETPVLTEGIIVLYMGETTESFENGKFYRYNGEGWDFIQIGNEFGLTPGLIVIADEDGNLTTSPVTAEYLDALEYIQTVTSPVQAQLNALGSDLEGLEDRMDTAEDNIVQLRNTKQDVVTGGATSILTDDLTASRALVSDADGKVAVSDATATEVGYLTGATSNIQNQIDTLSALVSALEGMRMVAVDELPETGESGIIYLVPTAEPETGNVRDEYLWVNDAWELIGNTSFKLEITQDENGIAINGTSLQDADSTHPGLMTVSQVERLSNVESEVDDHEDRIKALEDSPYELPIASADTLGGIRIGDGLTITEDGTVSVTSEGGVASVGLSKSEDANSLVLTVNGVPQDTVNPISSISGSVADDELTITVNGVSSVAIGLPTFKQSVMTLPASGWNDNVQSITVAGVTADNIVFVAPSPAYYTAYGNAGIYASAQGIDTLTFTCANEPENDIDVNILIW